jgi:aminoglycoside phosphotransferase (APT) family kinase protein
VPDRERVTTPWRRDPRAVEAGLGAWAHTWRGPHATVTDVRMPGSGMANDTVLFRVDGEALVARLAPAADSHYPTFPTFDLALQRRVMDLVRERTEVPAPEVVHLEPSADWLDVPFMVVRAIDGEVASDNPPYLMDPNGWFLRGGPDDWQRLETSTIDVFAQVHTIVDGVDTEFLRADAPGDTALARLLASHRHYYEWARDGRTVPVLERAFEVLTKTLPATARSVLLWGDGRPGNIIYRDFEPVGVLDWEMAGVGPPEADVAWATFFQRFWAGMAEPYGVSVPAMFDPAACAAAYERSSGTALDDLSWYEALAGYRFGIILMRMGLRSIAYGQLPEPDDIDELMMFPRLLEELLEAI